MKVELPPGTRISIIPFGDAGGAGPFGRQVAARGSRRAVGSTLTLSNVALGPVGIALRAGYGIAVAYPPAGSDD